MPPTMLNGLTEGLYHHWSDNTQGPVFMQFGTYFHLINEPFTAAFNAHPKTALVKDTLDLEIEALSNIYALQHANRIFKINTSQPV